MNPQFTQHCQVVPPINTVAELCEPSFQKPEPIAPEEAKRRRLAAEIEEVFGEGRIHRNTRIKRHE